ncbi:uncharacterized protein TNCV_2916601 [Trichonephila clavipes]|nr:uncharacterized protein TNCV_2916601 [Trichonephila clavipes]
MAQHRPRKPAPAGIVLMKRIPLLSFRENDIIKPCYIDISQCGSPMPEMAKCNATRLCAIKINNNHHHHSTPLKKHPISRLKFPPVGSERREARASEESVDRFRISEILEGEGEGAEGSAGSHMVSAVPGFLPDDRYTASLVGLRGGWRHARMKFCTHIYGSNAAVPGPKLPPAIKAGYLNCKIRPNIPNPLRCFKCQRFGHSQTSCRSQLTCSRCASVGHASTDCSLEPKCINCSQPHTADSKLCPQWKTEKQIQEIKTHKNITYVEARKLIVPQLVQTYAKAAKPSIVNNSTQTDENITKIKCQPLNLLQPLSSLPKQNKLISTPVISMSSSSTQAELLPSISSKAAAVLQPGPPIPMSNDILSNNMLTPIESSSNVSTSLSNDIQPPSTSSTVRDSKQNSKTRIRKRKKELLKKLNEEKIDIKMAPYRRKKQLQQTTRRMRKILSHTTLRKMNLNSILILFKKTVGNIGKVHYF